MLADQGDECHRAEILLGPTVIDANDTDEVLVLLVRPNGNDEPAADRQLVHERVRNLGAASRDEYRVKRTIGIPTIGTVASFQRDVPNPKLRETKFRFGRKLRQTLDGENLACERCQYSGLISRARAYLEYLFLAG